MASIPLEDYHIGIITALKVEQAAVRGMLDEEYGMIKDKDVHDHNVYFAGRVHHHHVVVACLPAGVDGTTAAATVARDMMRTLPNLRFGLLVGIGGGIPDLQRGIDIRLGDVVVSQPYGIHGGVVQYSKGKYTANHQWERKGALNAPPTALLTALQALQTKHELEDSEIPQYLEQMVRKWPKMRSTGYLRSEDQTDILYMHPISSTSDIVPGSPRPCQRPRRMNDDPHIHYGTIASGNQVVKNAILRDHLRDEYGALCVEMEAAGLMNDFPCLVIRGVCDYADEYKNDDWHRYAAAVAAAFGKELLQYVSAQETSQAKPIQRLAEQLGQHLRQQEVSAKRQDAHFQRQDMQYEHDKHQKYHRFFKVTDYESDKDLNPRPAAGTCRWVLDHPKYKKWATSDKVNLLWISADPGCGKSVLARALVDDRCAADPKSGLEWETRNICYFFFKDRENQDTMSAALCAILHQFFSQQPALVHHAAKACETQGELLQRDVNELCRIWESATSDTDARPVTCIFDALDECRDADRSRLIRWLSRLHDESSGPAVGRATSRWLVTSRPYDNVQDSFSQIPAHFQLIRLRGEDDESTDQMREEIDLVIDKRMGELSRDLGLSHEKTEQLTRQLRHMRNRTYLWLDLVLDEVKSGFRRSLRPDQEPLPSLPASVEEAYSRILARITHTAEKKHARAIFTIIIGARRPLTVPEMALAMGIAVSERIPSSLLDLTIDYRHLKDRIRQWCGLFVFCQHDRLYLFHQTAKEFLLTQNGRSLTNDSEWKHCLSFLDVEKHMARMCVGFLCLLEFSNSRCFDQETNDHDEHLQTQSFFSFAANHWASYVRSIEGNIYDDDDDIQRRVRSLYDTSSGRWDLWTAVVDKTTNYEYLFFDMNDIQLAAFNGHVRVVQYLLDVSPSKLNARQNLDDRTALEWASQRGHLEVVRILLDRKPHVDVGRSLREASSNGHLEIVRALLMIEPHSASFHNDLNHALVEASTKGHLDIVQILLRQRAGDNLYDALSAASERGHVDIVRALLHAGADPNAAGVLYAASEKGLVAIVRALLDHGADANATARHYTRATALQAASWAGHLDIVRMLLDKGADTNASQHGNLNALEAASLEGHLDIVRMLLERGADVDARGGRYPGALHAASANNHQEVMIYLACWGASRKKTVDNDGSILEWALHHGHLQTALPLISHDASVNSKREQCVRALHIALKYGYSEVVQRILDNGFDVNAPIGPYCGMLEWCIGEGLHTGFEQILLTHGTDLNAKDRGRGNALYIASSQGNLRMVQMLLARGAEVNTVSGHHGKALHAASVEGHVQVVHTLLEKGADAEDHYALRMASSRNHIQVVQALLGNGFADASGEALKAASEAGHLKLVQLLLDNGADPDVLHPLCAASSHGHLDVVQALLDKGANINIGNVLDLTALSAASQHGYTAVVHVLLVRGACDHGGRALEAACRGGHLEVVQALLHSSVKPNDARIALVAACQGGHVKVLRALLGKGVVDDDGSALYAALWARHLNIVQTLVNPDPGLDAFGTVIAESKLDDLNMVRMLAGMRAHVEKGPRSAQHGRLKILCQVLDESVDYTSATAAVIVASKNGDLEMVQMLLDDGFCDETGYALDIASRSGQYDIAQALTNGRRIPCLTSAVYHAARAGNLEIVSLLLSRSSAQISHHPLVAASEEGHLEIVKLLLREGCVDVDGQALNAASKKGYLEITQELLARQLHTIARGYLNQHGDASQR